MSEQDGAGDTARPSSPRPVRVTYSDSELEKIPVSELASRWRQQESYVTNVEQRLSQLEGRYSIHSLVEHYC